MQSHRGSTGDVLHVILGMWQEFKGFQFVNNSIYNNELNNGLIDIFTLSVKRAIKSDGQCNKIKLYLQNKQWMKMIK